jgi:hypothetical protein
LNSSLKSKLSRLNNSYCSFRVNDSEINKKNTAVPEQLAENFFASFECENITINIKFYKYILAVNKRTTNLAVLVEHGKFPAYISVVCSIFMYWQSTVQSHQFTSLPSLRPNDDVLSSRQKLIKLFLDNLLNWV